MQTWNTGQGGETKDRGDEGEDQSGACRVEGFGESGEGCYCQGLRGPAHLPQENHWLLIWFGGAIGPVAFRQIALGLRQDPKSGQRDWSILVTKEHTYQQTRLEKGVEASALEILPQTALMTLIVMPIMCDVYNESTSRISKPEKKKRVAPN